MNLKHVVGPPGTGKTHRLMGYIEQLIKAGIAPNAICFSSFTRSAVLQAKERMAARFGLDGRDLPLFGTLHSLAYRRLSLTRDNVLNGKRWGDFCKSVNLAYTKPGGWADDDPFEPLGAEEGDTLKRFYDWQRNCLLPMDEALRLFDVPPDGPWSPTRARWFVAEIEKYKTEFALYDFVDMLLEIDQEEWVPPARVLLVDETQDLSPLQQRIVLRWTHKIGNVLMAYDPDQAIYGFQGAAPEWLLQLDGAREFLTQSHRVPRLAAAVSQRIIRRNSVRYANTWLPKEANGELKFGADLSEVTRMAGEDRSGWYFLARNRFYLGPICDALKRRGVPYRNLRGASPQVSGAVLCALQLASGIAVSRDDVHRLAEATSQVGWWVRGAKAELQRSLVDRAQERVDLSGLFELGAEPALMDVLSRPERCLKPLKFAEDTKNYFLRVWQRYGLPGLTAEPWATVSTIHGVKGGEQPNVVLSPQMTRRTAEGYEQDPEPERRVWYVGTSRTSDRLFILDPEGTGATFTEF